MIENLKNLPLIYNELEQNNYLIKYLILERLPLLIEIFKEVKELFDKKAGLNVESTH
jgi:hypothetical protein